MNSSGWYSKGIWLLDARRDHLDLCQRQRQRKTIPAANRYVVGSPPIIEKGLYKISKDSERVRKVYCLSQQQQERETEVSHQGDMYGILKGSENIRILGISS